MRNFVRQALSMLAGGLIVGGVLLATQVGAQEAPAEQPDAPAEAQTVVQASPRIPYQGQITDPFTGLPKPNGAYGMTFRIYDSAVGGTTLWTESKNVQVFDGLFSTFLGDLAALPSNIFDGRALFLGIQVGGEPEASPRQPFGYVPYAMYAASSAGSAGTPVAFGVINENGSRGNNYRVRSSRFSSSDGWYEIEIEGENYNLNDFVTVATAIRNEVCLGPTILTTNSRNGRLVVLQHGLDGMRRQCKFHIAVFKP